MKDKFFLLGLLTCLVLVGCCTVINVTPHPSAVKRVTDVKVYWERAGTAYDLVIVASGTVPSSGYNSPWLDPLISLNPPSDGYLTLGMLTKRPGSDTADTQVITTLVVTNRWSGGLGDVRGVRVIGQENQVCRRVGQRPALR